jgi:hypothetical protein
VTQNKDIVMNNHTGAFSEGMAATRPQAITMDKKAVVNFMIVGWRSKAGGARLFEKRDTRFMRLEKAPCLPCRIEQCP